MKIRHAAVPVSLAACLVAGFVMAGPLNPPGGPIASTFKTLSEVEPRTAINAANTPGDADSLFTITQPGSYYLTGSITGVSGKSGIKIASSGVSIDLNGFELRGVAGSLDGVTMTTAYYLANISIRNGSARGWGRDGINLVEYPPAGMSMTDILSADNARYGIGAGYSAVLTRCNACANGSHGILAQDGATITDCGAESNTGIGIFTGSGCTIAHCTAFANGWHGIDVGDDGCVITACTVRENRVAGIFTLDQATISNCSVSGSYGDDIEVASQCVVLNNTCSAAGFLGNDGAAIHVLGTDNRIEGNNCTISTRGVDVDQAGNLIIRNTCSGNLTNWSIVTFNAVAPIIAATGNGSAISGNAYAGGLGSTDPNANFTY
jgi:hypothetical protein